MNRRCDVATYACILQYGHCTAHLDPIERASVAAALIGQLGQTIEEILMNLSSHSQTEVAQ